MNTFLRHLFASRMRRAHSPIRACTSRQPAHRRTRLFVEGLEVRIVPSAPPPPPGFTSTTTPFTNTTQVLISATGAPTVTSTITVSGVGTYLHDLDLTT